MQFHYQTVKELFSQFESGKDGLSSEIVQKKTQKFGKNVLEAKKKKTKLQIFLHQFADFMIFILLAAAMISGFLGDVTDLIIILVIIILNAAIGFYQEYRAEEALEALKKMATTTTKVLRNHQWIVIDSHELVPGDVIMLEAGNSVPADVRWLETHSVKVDESALTGESVTVDKDALLPVSEDSTLADRTNMAYKGTLITNGRGLALVVATGMKTEIGKIASLLQQDDENTPLKKRMADFGKKLSYLILGICVLLVVLGLTRNENFLEILLISISLAVAAIPEALPALITIALAIGAKRMAKKNALIRKLPAVETLGSVTFICSDKTGTLTVNKMKVEETYIVENPHIQNFSPFTLCLALNHDVKIGENQELIGDSTETALVEYVLSQYRSQNFQEMFPRIAEIPFDSTRKCMTTIHQLDKKFLVLTKGATEFVTSRLRNTELSQEIEKKSEDWARNGLRVLAFSYKILDEMPTEISSETIEKELIFAGIAGMIDPTREEVKQSVTECIRGGIKPVMITGDHPATSLAIAKQIGIYQEGDLVISGKELQRLSPSEIESKIEKVSVFARVTPEQKLQIINALQEKGHFVAMTGDGVNDAPSLKAADIGVAMGINGTDVAREASDMILLDDNFATIINAIREGRRIYDNIRKFVKYILTCNLAEILTIFMAPFFGLPIPLLPIHILWINLVTDGLPGLALAGEKEEKDIMNRPPRPPKESLFAHGIGFHIVWVGILMSSITLLMQYFSIHYFGSHWQTMVFTVLSLSQFGHVLAIGSEKNFLFQQGIFSNQPLIFSLLTTTLLQLSVIYVPILNEWFRTEPLTINELLICIAASAVVFHMVELEKFIKSFWKTSQKS